MKKAILGMAVLQLTFQVNSYAASLPHIENQEGVQMTHEKPAPQYLYKVISIEGWHESQQKNHVINSALDDQFIHLATESQLPHITQKFWHGKRYYILKLDAKKMKGRLVFEVNPGGTTQYYHLYEGIIPLDAVIDVIPADSL